MNDDIGKRAIYTGGETPVTGTIVKEDDDRIVLMVSDSMFYLIADVGLYYLRPAKEGE